jgi:hypothetical protein
VTLPKRYQINQVEYQIRKIERGIKVLYSQGASSERILEYGSRREKLKDKLEKLTEEKYFSSVNFSSLSLSFSLLEPYSRILSEEAP